MHQIIFFNNIFFQVEKVLLNSELILLISQFQSTSPKFVLSVLNNSLKQVNLKMCDYDSFLDMDLFNSPTFITIFELSFEDVKKLTESEFRNKLIHLKSGIKISMYYGYTYKYRTSRCGMVARLTNGTKVDISDAMSLV